MGEFVFDSVAGTAALQSVSTCDWATQEACYTTLIKILGNIVSNPAEVKYRRLKLTNATLRAKIFDVPGARGFLDIAGFSEEEAADFLTVTDERVTSVAKALAQLKAFADEANTNELRRLRDERIAEANARDNKPTLLQARMTDEEKKLLREQLERDRAEFEKERELHPVGDSKAKDLKFGAHEGDTSFLRKRGG
uniref:PUB domain-containing protein n=1 Tax=Noctiluca scintillans TaxID=2966 RepID=A0A7S1AF61_NOCSC|mmetsp:Transcript_43833/g.115792  ORF Transcript_43833/g.115792 Transcript_43833/m.115792 type:complete len:195 (+) Transcript_43833:72-656(+)